MTQQYSQLKVKIDEKLRNEMNNSKCIMAVHRPSDNWIYVGNETDPELCENNFQEGMNAIHMGDFNKVLIAHDLGKLGESEWLDKIQYGIFNKKDGWQDRAVDYQDKMKAAAASGISVPDYSGIEVSAMTAIIYGLQERTHVLQNALRFVDIEGTKYEYPELTSRVTISRNITYGDPIAIKSVGIKHNTKELLCDAAHFAMFDDVRYRPTSVDIWRTNLEAIGAAFIRDTAEQVSELLLSASITTIAALGLWTTSTVNPYIDIAKAFKDIEDNNGMPDKSATHDLVMAAHAGNPNTKTDAMTSQPERYGAKTLNGSLYSGLESWIDNLMHTQKVTVWDSFFAPFVRGPQGVGQYRDVPRFQNGWLSFQWKLMFLADLTKIRMITGATGL